MQLGMARSKSSARWLKEHFEDAYVKRAQQSNYRSRAVFKLQEIDAKDRLIKPGMLVVDLGAAPGGWSQYAASRVGEGGQVVALDILPMDSLAGVEFIQGDFRERAVLDQIVLLLKNHPVDLVISDMAPNTSGINAVDQPRIMYLAELALDLSRQSLRPGGDMLIKVFQGEGFDALLAETRQSFAKVVTRKPKASRPRSKELYLLARNYGV